MSSNVIGLSVTMFVPKLGCIKLMSKPTETVLRLNRLLDPRVQRYFEDELRRFNSGKQQEMDGFEIADAEGSSNFGTVLLILKLKTA